MWTHPSTGPPEPAPARRHEWLRTAVVLLVFAAAFAFLTLSSYITKSATWDEPGHLTSGYFALHLHDYRLNPGHLPLLRMWAALPLVFMGGIHLDTDTRGWGNGSEFEAGHEFLYVQNDADRLLYAARFMTVLLGVLLGILIFCWIREWMGFRPAVVVLALYCLEPNILAHSSLVTTDLGTACFIFGAVYFLWRLTRKCSAANLAGLVAFFALAEASKFSALLLWPIAAALLVLHIGRRAAWPCPTVKVQPLTSRGHKALVAAGVLVLLGVGSYTAVWAIYGFRYAPTPGSPDVRFHTNPLTRTAAPQLAAAIDWVDRHHLLPNAWSQGFLLMNAAMQKHAAFLAGDYSSEGWWYYFPVAFLIKTPLGVLLPCCVGLALCVARWRRLTLDDLFVLLPIAVFMSAAVSTPYNIGLRHILPIYPFVLLLAGKPVAELYRRGHCKILLLLPLVALVECMWIYPDYLAFFNAFVGGPRNGYKYLADSNLDWGQDLKQLKAWMDMNHVPHINLSYFGTADPAYYGIRCTHLLGAPFFARRFVQQPELPGYVAVSVTNLQGVYRSPSARAFYLPLSNREPAAVLGHSIRIYRVDAPWW